MLTWNIPCFLSIYRLCTSLLEILLQHSISSLHVFILFLLRDFISLSFLLWSIGYSREYYLISIQLWIFQPPRRGCYWFLLWCHCGQRRSLVYDFILLEFAELFCRLTHGLTWKMFPVFLRIPCILMLLARMFCTYLLGLFTLLFNPSVSLLILCLNGLCAVESGVLKSLPIFVLLFIYLSRSVSFHFIY